MVKTGIRVEYRVMVNIEGDPRYQRILGGNLLSQLCFRCCLGLGLFTSSCFQLID